MFHSYEYQKYLGYNAKTEQYSHQYKIIDTDFVGVGIVVGAAVGGDGIEIGGGTAVIDCYTKRGLPVAPNLFRAMLYTKSKYGWSLDEQVECNKKYNQRWHEVEQDMKMYLLFS